MNFNFLLVYACLLWILAVVLIMGDYTTFKNAKEIKMQYDLSKYTSYDYSKNTLILYGCLALFASVSFLVGNQSVEMLIINGAILVMSLAEFITAKIHFKLYINEKEIIYENEVYRIKSLKSVKKMKRFGRNHEVTTFDGKSFTVNKPLATTITTLMEEKKEEKQARKKR